MASSSGYRKIKVESTKRKKIIIFLITISLLFISGGYSFLNSELGFLGTLTINKYNYNDNIRITNVELIDKKNNGNEINKPNYSSNRTGMYASLPAQSYIIYKVEIYNKSSNDFVLENISSIISNDNVGYELIDINNEDIISKNEKKFFNVKIMNNTNSFQEASLILNYIFEKYELYSISYDLGGGTVSTTNPTTYTKYTPDFTLNNPTRSGFEFLGWIEGSNTANKTLTIKKGTTGNKTFKASWKDNQPPVLSLSAETIVDYPFSGWTLTDATVDSNGVLTLNSTSSYATSDFIDVNGEFWYPTFDAYSDYPSPNSSPDAGIYWGTTYYDSSKKIAQTLDNYSSNGWAVSFPIGAWKNDIIWSKTVEALERSKRYGPNVKYVVLTFAINTWSSAPPIKIRNFKIHGQVKNSNYNINITSSDNVGVTVKKYAKGNQNKDYFKTGGTTISGDMVNVTENGTYTFYVADSAGNSTIQTIEISNIK